MKVFFKAMGLVLILCLLLGGLSIPDRVNARSGTELGLNINSFDSDSPYFSRSTVLTDDGTSLDKIIISGPPQPPPGYELQRNVAALPVPNQVMGTNSLTVPAYNWVFGCSAVSAAMIAGYYDNNGYANMYTGPANGGVAPATSAVWGSWTDASNTIYPNNPLIASHLGADNRAIKGSIDDYWVGYGSSTKDPYLTGPWAQHTWGDSVGDYMKTSQSEFDNTDGSTAFYSFTVSSTPLSCSAMPGYRNQKGNLISDVDGTYGRKLFYEARGYTVTDCYNQATDNKVSGGFSFAQYKSQIDAGQPVLLNLEGHSIVGIGYDDIGNTVYIHDTWDYLTHTMTWGGSYSGMELLSVSIVNLASIPPVAFEKTSPTNTSTGIAVNPTLSWETSPGAKSYEYCIDSTGGDSTCSTTWTTVNGNTSVTLSNSLTNGTTYYWQVHAINSPYTTAANGGSWWSFTVGSPTAVTVTDFTSALAQPAGIALHWTSANEINTLGYNLYRTKSPGGEYTLVNSIMIPAQNPGSMDGNSYTYVDTNAVPGVRYLYKLMHVDTNLSAIECSSVDGGYYLVQLPLVLQ